MPAVVRLGDKESHKCHTTSGSLNVFVNGIPICRVGDGVCCAIHNPPHPSDGVIVEGSPNVFANGRPVARVGDKTEHEKCGEGKLLSGSPNVFANGG